MSLNRKNPKLAVYILTYNEEIHLKRCLESIFGLADEIYVIDSFSTDCSVDIAQSFGAKVVQRHFKTQADQLQWAFSNQQTECDWILRLDADEVIGDDLAENMTRFMNADGYGGNGGVLNRKHIFLGKWIRYGGRYPLQMLRLFRNGKARVEQRWMDEHIVLTDGKSRVIEGGFEDNNLNTIGWFIEKHNGYAAREMIDVILGRYSLGEDSNFIEGSSMVVRFRRIFKQGVYLKLPLFLRPFLYFIYRYFIQLGFLDGAPGVAYHVLQGFWYRFLVDVKIYEAEKLLVGVTSSEEIIKTLEKITLFDIKNNRKQDEQF